MDVRQRPIDRESWAAYCRVFARRHRGWLVRLSEVRAGGSRTEIAPEAPLESVELGLRAAPPTGRPEDSLEIVVRLAATDGGEPASLTVVAPQGLSDLVRSDGADVGLQIAIRGGDRLELRFSSPARADDVDGYVGNRR